MSQTFNLKPDDWTLFILKPCWKIRLMLYVILAAGELKHGLEICLTGKWRHVFPQCVTELLDACECVHICTCVGVMWLISSAASCFSRVVFPALSKPSNSKRTSCSGDCFSLRRMDNRPCRWSRVHAMSFNGTMGLKMTFHRQTQKHFLTIFWLNHGLSCVR